MITHNSQVWISVMISRLIGLEPGTWSMRMTSKPRGCSIASLTICSMASASSRIGDPGLSSGQIRKQRFMRVSPPRRGIGPGTEELLAMGCRPLADSVVRNQRGDGKEKNGCSLHGQEGPLDVLGEGKRCQHSQQCAPQGGRDGEPKGLVRRGLEKALDLIEGDQAGRHLISRRQPVFDQERVLHLMAGRSQRMKQLGERGAGVRIEARIDISTGLERWRLRGRLLTTRLLGTCRPRLGGAA